MHVAPQLYGFINRKSIRTNRRSHQIKHMSEFYGQPSSGDGGVATNIETS